MQEGVVFLQRDVWSHLCSKGNSKARGLVCDVMSHSEVHTDVPKESLLEDEDLLQAYTDNGGRFVFDYHDKKDEFVDSVNIIPLCSVFLVENDTLYCDGRSELHGIVVLNKDKLSRNPAFFEKKEVYVSKEKIYKFGWNNDAFSVILKNHKCNTLILFDKYICKDGRIDKMNPNLEKLLLCILPTTISDITFQISIYSEFDICKGEQIYKEICDCIKNIRPNLRVQLTLYQNKSDIHDRIIVTNTFMIKSGAGFALFKGNGSVVNETNVEYYPYKRQEYYQRIKAASEISNHSFANENMRNYWGDKENRLFELAEKKC